MVPRRAGTRQIDGSLSLVPRDPPATMMDRDSLVQAVEEGVEARVSYCVFVSRDHDYIIDLLPCLAPVVKFNEVRVLNSFILTCFDLIKISIVVIFFWQEADATRISFVLDLRIHYVGETTVIGLGYHLKHTRM